MLRPKALTTILFALAIMLSAFRLQSQRVPLTINVTGIEQKRGKVVVEIYNEKSGWLKKPFRSTRLVSDGTIQSVSFDVPLGKYAVSVYQDFNDNNQLDMNFLSIPKEPIGFGNNYKPFGKPNFESALVEHTPNTKPQAIKLFSVF